MSRLLIATITVLLMLPGAPAAAQDPVVIGYGDTATGELAAGAEHEYRFEAGAGDVAILDVLEGRGVDLRWRLQSADGAVLFDGLYVDRSAELEGGTYTLSVRGATAAFAGPYGFRLLRVPAPEELTIAFGDTVEGSVEVPGAVDRYRFEGTAGDRVILDALTRSNDVRWSLQAPDGSEVFHSTYADREVTLDHTGTYTLAVSGLSITSAGSYTFQLLRAPSSEEFTIGFGDTVSNGVPAPGAGNLESPGAVDLYRFDAVAGTVARLEALTGSTTDVRWSLQAPDGSTVFDAFFVDQEVTLALTGAYRLQVRGQGADGSGAYSFRLQAAPANRTPVAEDDAVETEHGAVVRIDVLANDSDPDGDELTLEAVTEPAHGTSAIDGDRVTYTPQAGFAGTDSFTYTLTDGRGGSAGATVIVTVREPPNRPPAITEIADRQSTVGDGVALQVEAEDADGDALAYAATGLPPGLRIDAQTGLIDGTIARGAEVGSPYAVEVKVTDARGATAAVTFRWEVRTGSLDADVDVLVCCVRNDGHGVIPLLIFGSDRLDVRRIDFASVTLGGMPVQRLFGWYAAIVHDFDRDGTDDVLVLIDDVAGALPAGTTRATVSGRLRDGTQFAGTDELCVRDIGRSARGG